MNKIFKATLVVAAVASIGMGSYKAYGYYATANMSEEELLLAENVLALSESHAGQSQISKHTVYRIKKSFERWGWDATTGTKFPIYRYDQETGYYQTCNTLSKEEAKKYPKCQNDVCTNYACAEAQGWSSEPVDLNDYI